mmetsp:Transcript_12639/g.19159  ORF Transcript_12639/g.19159 Transcript_12639/m.19159 type:complete len:137 (+) Transcript_12639:96-506(+)
MANTVAAIFSVDKALEQLLTHTEGLRSITVSDRDGVALLKLPEDEAVKEVDADQVLTTIFSLTTEQTAKLPIIGQTNFILTTFDECVCLQANLLPLVIRLVADKSMNTGDLIGLLDSIKAVLETTKTAVQGETDSY